MGADTAYRIVEAHGFSNNLAFDPEGGEGIGEDPDLPRSAVSFRRDSEYFRLGLCFISSREGIISNRGGFSCVGKDALAGTMFAFGCDDRPVMFDRAIP